jgi:O-antigen ligase
MEDHMGKLQHNTIILIWLISFSASIEFGIFFMQLFIAFGLFLLALSWQKKNFNTIPKHPAFLPMIMFGVSLIIAAAFSDHPLASIQRVFRNYSFAVLGFMSIVYLVKSDYQRDIGIKTLLIAGAFGGANAIFQYFTGIDPIYGQEIHRLIATKSMTFYTPVGLLNHPFTFAGVQLTVFLLCLPYLWRKGIRNNILFWIMEAIILISIFISMRRSVFLGVVIAGGLYMVTRSRRVAILTVIVTSLVFMLAYFSLPGFDERINKFLDDGIGSEHQRAELWKTALVIGKDNPIVGVGPGNWSENASKHLPEEFLFGHPHNDTLNIWAISGGLGLTTFLIFYFSIFTTWWRESKIVYRNSSNYDIYLGGILALFGLSIASQFQCFMIDGENLIALGLTMGVSISARNQLISDIQE